MNVITVMRRAIGAALAPLLLAAGAPAAAQTIPGYPEHVTEYDPREVVMLPEYCKYTQLFRDRVPGGNNREMIQRWHATMGDVFIHMHHYCWGLMHLHRAKVLARDAQARGFNYDSAVREFEYIMERTPREFPLLPEMLTKKGEALLARGKTALALAEFERAIELKPDYWPPYAHISDHYRSAGDLVKAREVLEAGLTRSRGAKGLQRRLEELDRESAKASDKRRP
jgi:tetratricopeptide (TPR) repeat protein